MKKKLFSISMLLVITSISLFADSWFSPIVTSDFSYTWNGKILNQEFPNALAITDITLGTVLFNYLWVEGQVITYYENIKTSKTSGHLDPFVTDYGVRAGLQQFGMRIGYERFYYQAGTTDTVFVKFDLERLLKEKRNKK